jgi:hypothetical protein
MDMAVARRAEDFLGNGVSIFAFLFEFIVDFRE